MVVAGTVRRIEVWNDQSRIVGKGAVGQAGVVRFVSGRV